MPKEPRSEAPDLAEDTLDRRELINWLAVLGVAAGGAAVGGLPVAAQPSDSSGKRTEEDHGPPGQGTYVVINHEEQYSIWPSRETPPRGWRARSEPVSLRQAVEQVPGPAGKLRFQVVINHEEQYSIWPVDHQVPKGFRVKKKDCRLTDCAKAIGEGPPGR